MTSDQEKGKIDPAQVDGLYKGPSRGHTIDRYAKTIGVPRAYGYGASMGAWVLDYVANWAGETGFISHSNPEVIVSTVFASVVYVTVVDAGTVARSSALSNVSTSWSPRSTTVRLATGLGSSGEGGTTGPT